MHKLFLIFILSGTYIFANINVIVSILPQQTFLKAIGGGKVNITLMVQPGNSPHTYEPRPSQMKSVSKAELYLAIDVEFEDVWLQKFKNLNTKMQVIDIAEGVPKISMHTSEVNSNEKKSHDAHAHHHESDDPHIWTAPHNVKIIAQNIYEALIKVDAKNKAYYLDNLKIFLQDIERTHLEIEKILSSLKQNRSFMVFHPSWGYFAKAYGLKQIAVEVEGKSPTPKTLIHIIKEAKEEKIHAIFTQPEFSDSTAKIIAKELNIPVLKVSPLAPNWSENLLNIAKAIAGQK